MASNALKRQTLTYLLGKCVPCSKQNAAKVRVCQLDFDEHLLMYFKKYSFVYASDPQKSCKTGDTVLIQNLPEKLTRLITHKIVKVVYPLGDITDPVTGKKLSAAQYRDSISEITKLYGKHNAAFDYDKAPQRGRLEGIRDFTDKETYLKYHDDPNNPDPYAIDP